MRVVFILSDSVNRRFLSCYPTQRETAITPNIDRLAKMGMVFDNHWCGSAPCMPARRDIMTGRLNFLERMWGGIEPFDHTLPELLRTKNVYSHMVTDHFHYAERGGENYWGAFTSWRLERGTEHDTCFWGPDATGIPHPEKPRDYCGYFSPSYSEVKEHYQGRKEQYSTARVFDSACEFLERSKDSDNFLLWVEGFDPHEPFDVPQEFLDFYPEEQDQEDSPYWPEYVPADRYSKEQIRTFRHRYRALLSMTDYYIGKLLSVMDRNDMWKNTVLVFTTDHGYLLGEHGFMAKNYMPDFNEIYHIPLIVCAPEIEAGRCSAVTENIDLFPTMLDWFGVDPAQCRNLIHGKSILPLLRQETDHVRQAALFGMFGKTVNVTDGRYVFMKAPKDKTNSPLTIYGSTLTMLNQYIGYDSIREEDMHKIKMGHLPWTPFPVYQIPADIVHSPNTAQDTAHINDYVEGDRLYDLQTDYAQQHPIDDASLLQKYRTLLIQTMKAHEAPPEQLKRLGLLNG